MQIALAFATLILAQTAPVEPTGRLQTKVKDNDKELTHLGAELRAAKADIAKVLSTDFLIIPVYQRPYPSFVIINVMS